IVLSTSKNAAAVGSGSTAGAAIAAAAATSPAISPASRRRNSRLMAHQLNRRRCVHRVNGGRTAVAVSGTGNLECFDIAEVFSGFIAIFAIELGEQRLHHG